MTEQEKINELMKPRYKVIADYFHNPYKVGDIITLPENNRSVHLTTVEYTDEFGENVKQHEHHAPSVLDNFTHLFRKLQWWEEREPDALPPFVRDLSENKILKARYKFSQGVLVSVATMMQGTGWYGNALPDLEPATAADYQAFTTKPVNQE